MRRPELADVQMGKPVDGCARNDAIVVAGIALGFHQPLASTRRASVEIGILRPLTVVRVDDSLGLESHFMHGAIAVIDPALRVGEPVLVRRSMPGVRRGRSETVADGLSHGTVTDDTGQTATADGLEPAVPVLGQPDFETDRGTDNAGHPAHRGHPKIPTASGLFEAAGGHAFGFRDHRFRQHQQGQLFAVDRRESVRGAEEDDCCQKCREWHPCS